MNERFKILWSKFMYFFRNRRYDVYCPHCTSCGEAGCCSPTICTNKKGGFYCERNMGELRASYRTVCDFYNWISPNKNNTELSIIDVFNKLDEIMDKNDNEMEKDLRSLPQKLTLIDRIKKYIS